MKLCTPEPLYSLRTPEGQTLRISQPVPGDELAVLDGPGHYTMPLPIVGWARSTDGELSLYTAGPDSALFRLALEEGVEEEVFFAGRAPETLREYRLDEYAAGALLYQPLLQASAPLMGISYLKAA